MNIKLFFTLLLGVTISFTCYAQDGKPYVSIGDTYVLKVEMLEVVRMVKCPCSMGHINKIKSCKLMKVAVKDIIIQKDTSVYSERELFEMRYFVVYEKEVIEKNKEYVFYSRNSSNEAYLIVNEVFENRNIVEYSVSRAYISGLTKCSPLNIWNKARILSSFNREKTGERMNQKAKLKDPILGYIKENQ